MTERLISQKSIIEAKRVFLASSNRHLNYGDLLYERDFPDWFVIHAQTNDWDWTTIFVELRRGSFFFTHDITGFQMSIIPKYQTLSQQDAEYLGEFYIQKLAAYASTLPGSESLVRSLQLDGFDVNASKLQLVPLEGPVTARVEEDRLSGLVKSSGVPNGHTVLTHIRDASTLFAEGKDHPSLGESRNIMQSLIDGISTETAAKGKHAVNLPGGTSNRIEYLKAVGFFTPDEEAAFKSGWGTLSAGTHPGVPEREFARIGLILALEFGQLLMMKFTNWKAKAYQGF